MEMEPYQGKENSRLCKAKASFYGFADGEPLCVTSVNDSMMVFARRSVF